MADLPKVHHCHALWVFELAAVASVTESDVTSMPLARFINKWQVQKMASILLHDITFLVIRAGIRIWRWWSIVKTLAVLNEFWSSGHRWVKNVKGFVENIIPLHSDHVLLRRPTVEIFFQQSSDYQKNTLPTNQINILSTQNTYLSIIFFIKCYFYFYSIWEANDHIIHGSCYMHYDHF